MRQFKKNIFKTRIIDEVVPPFSNTYNGVVGSIFCNLGTIDIEDTSTKTLYGFSSELLIGDVLYEDTELKVPTTATAFKTNNKIHELNNGVIDNIYIPRISPC